MTYFCLKCFYIFWKSWKTVQRFRTFSLSCFLVRIIVRIFTLISQMSGFIQLNKTKSSKEIKDYFYVIPTSNVMLTHSLLWIITIQHILTPPRWPFLILPCLNIPLLFLKRLITLKCHNYNNQEIQKYL